MTVIKSSLRTPAETAAGAKPSRPHPLSPGVRRIALSAAGITLSCLLSEPEHTTPRATVIAVHGSGMSAGYFDGQAHPDLSLLTLGARLGFTVLSLDRPGYGHSATQLPDGQPLAEQSVTLHAALAEFAHRHEVGAGFFLLAHSFGGKVVLTAAADDVDAPLIGLDVSGCGHRYAVEPDRLPEPHSRAAWGFSWGAFGLYPPNTFLSSRSVVAPTPSWERREVPTWPDVLPDVARRIRAPVRFTFAEHERWWRHDQQAVAELSGMLTGSRVRVDRHPDAGHNISLGWAARSYHLRAFGFLEECLARRGMTDSR
ncbi:alpha/beta hydrolase [Streptomyces sp. R41]|uniref:Alpha/beta hydrolase n=1 Tax=Streptomyces sp. R41 TaxID=3238632 RepID=A0AB39RRA4_9ACTN